jgi:methylmalonyl-CoA/ethylmalonyl-CoA epimerase
LTITDPAISRPSQSHPLVDNGTDQPRAATTSTRSLYPCGTRLACESAHAIGAESAIRADYDQMSLFDKIDHVGIAVPDLDEAIAFYRDTFGVHSVHEEVNEEQGVREAMLAVGDGSTMIQLLAPLSPQSTIAKFLDRNGPGIQQLAYTVTDVEAVAAALRAKGLRLLYETARRGTADSRVNFIHPKDAGGVLVELVQHAEVEHADAAHAAPLS